MTNLTMTNTTQQAASKTAVLQEILTHKAVAVIRLNESVHALLAVAAILEGGVKIVEITLTTPNALEIISTICQTRTDALVGVGSVLHRGAAAEAIAAGAQFVVSPVMKPEIIEECGKHDVVGMIGAFSPTEILAAQEAGADIVKLSPAEFLGTAFIKAVKAPMPHLRIMPTGGVSLTNAGEWLQAGACAVGIGSALCDAKAVAARDFAALTANAQTIVRSIAAHIG